MDLAADEASTLAIKLFGAIEVRVEGIPMPSVRSRKVQWLLALLVLRPDREVERAWLAGVLWPESAPSQALFNLRQTLSHLRSALGRSETRLRSSTARTLLLDLTGASVDVIAFDAAVAQGDRAALEQAIALYGGPLLEGCSEEWVFSERQEREQRYLRALETLAEGAVARGEAAAAAGYLRRVIGMDPSREHAQRTLMQILASAGDHPAAVQVYRELRLWLRNELNADPDPDTQTLFQQVRSDAQRRAQVTPPVPAVLSSDPLPRRLPRPLTSLVGRVAEVRQVGASLSANRLVTLTGAGGMGKTRLAIAIAEEVAEEYPAGTFLIDLAPLTDPMLVVASVAAVLNVQEEPRCPLLATLRNYLQNKEALLVLDNCEHLIEACARLSEELLGECPRLHILTTSRQALGVSGEVVWQLEPLSLPPASLLTSARAAPPQDQVSQLLEYDAIHLFVQRAQQIQPTFQITRHNAEALVQICGCLDGMPLAIELAATRLRALTVAQIAARLHERFRLLRGGHRTALPRQQTLQATLDWSYDPLTPKEQRLLRWVSVFAGGWTLEAAEQVCGGDGMEAGEVLDLLSGLVDKSLVVFTEGREGGGRYRLLETVRHYGRERLAETQEERKGRERHGDYFLTLAENTAPKLRGSEQVQWLKVLEEEHDNLRQALTLYAEDAADGEAGEKGLRLGAALQQFWGTRGHLSEGRERLRTLLAHPGGQELTRARAEALNCAGALTSMQGETAHARVLYEESLAIRRELGDKSGIAISLNNLGLVAKDEGDYAHARILYEESLAIRRALGNKSGIANSLIGLGNVAYLQGDYAHTRALYEESLAIARALRNKTGMAHSLLGLGNVAQEQGDYGHARILYEESLAIARELGNKSGIAHSLGNLGSVVQAQGDHAAAFVLLEESLMIARELGDKGGIANSLLGLGNAAYSQGGYAHARALYAESLTTGRDLGDRRVIAYNLEAFASLAAQERQEERCVRLWGAAAALREALNSPLSPDESAKQRRETTAVQTALREDAFAAAWAQGRALTLKQAISYALGEVSN